MFGLGIIKGTIFGLTLGLISGVVIRELCIKNKKSTRKNSKNLNENKK
tara:strand:+ start:124 stop:267 length:144 start_codon:yes stop_codon:yes gene_type:complete